MPAYKNKENGSWYVVTQYTDWTGERKPKCKRGFATRREALEWEQKFQQQSAGDLDMSFEAFCEIYTNDLKARLKESTWQTKENIIKTKLLPYFGKRKINEITTKDVIAWQNELLAYRDENASHILRPISRRYTISSAPFSTTLSGFTISTPIRQRKPETWGQRNGGRCCSGRRKNIRNLLRR